MINKATQVANLNLLASVASVNHLGLNKGSHQGDLHCLALHYLKVSIGPHYPMYLSR
jgi:hypothetical protein